MADAVTQGVADLSVGAETPGTGAAECVAAAQAEVQAVMDEFIAERQALEERMQSKMTAALNKRAAAIKGLTADNEPAGHDGIPDFWFKAVKNHPLLGALVETHDEPALKHLTNVDWGYMPEMQVRRDTLMSMRRQGLGGCGWLAGFLFLLPSPLPAQRL